MPCLVQHFVHCLVQLQRPQQHVVLVRVLAARFRVPDGASMLPALLRELDAAGVAMTSVEVRRPSLDDVFLAKTGHHLEPEEATAADEPE